MRATVVDYKKAQVVRNNRSIAEPRVTYLEAAAAEGDLAGTLFWHWYDRGVGPGRYGVRSNDSTFAIITAHVAAMNAITGAKQSCDA